MSLGLLGSPIRCLKQPSMDSCSDEELICIQSAETVAWAWAGLGDCLAKIFEVIAEVRFCTDVAAEGAASLASS